MFYLGGAVVEAPAVFCDEVFDVFYNRNARIKLDIWHVLDDFVSLALKSLLHRDWLFILNPPSGPLDMIRGLEVLSFIRC